MASNASGVTKGYGQVELNMSTGIVGANMHSQVPAYEDATAATPIAQLENGQFLCVIADTAAVSPMGRIAVLPGAADTTEVPYLVYTDKKLYDERQGYSDFVSLADNSVDGVIYPKLIGLTPDTDIFTTNTINEDITNLASGDELFIGDDGVLSTAAGTNQTYKFVVNKVYTMPDGQPAVKLQVKKQ